MWSVDDLFGHLPFRVDEATTEALRITLLNLDVVMACRNFTLQTYSAKMPKNYLN